MNNDSNFFTSSGNLSITLIEALDLLTVTQSKSIWTRKVKPTSTFAFGVVSLTHPNRDEEVVKYRTATIPYFAGDLLHLGEEFIFESLSSSHCLVISLYTVNQSKTKLIGTVKIPIARLEENNTITQWYQLQDPRTNEGLRSALRMKSIFICEAKRRKDLMMNNNHIHHLYSRTVDDDVNTMNLSKHSKHNSMMLKEALHTLSEFNILSTSGHGGIMTTTLEQAAYSTDHLRLESTSHEDTAVQLQQPLTLDYAALSTASHHHGHSQGLHHYDLSPKPSFDKHLSRRSLVSLGLKEIDVSWLDKSLPVGIVDYCLILGPKQLANLRPTHHIEAPGYFERLMIDTTKGQAAVGSNNSPILSDFDRSYNGSVTWSTTTSSWIPVDSEDIIVWDKLPLLDLKEAELPSKVEWFACSEGPITVESYTRPDPFVTSFILNAGSDATDVLGVALHMFIRLGLSKRSKQQQQQQKGRAEDHHPPEIDDPSAWWRVEHEAGGFYQAGKDGEVEGKTEYLWTTITLCFLFRQSFFDELSDCLLFAYHHGLEGVLAHWEEENYQQYQQQSLTPAGQQSLSSKPPPVDIRCQILLGELITTLHMGCPTPIPDRLILHLLLRPHQQLVDKEETTKHISFAARSITGLPKSSSFAFILQTFGSKLVVEILCCLLAESRVLFHSRNTSNLRKICEVFKAMLYPLAWTHVYLPIVPVHLLHLVEAPVPFLLGTHTDNLRFINFGYVNDLVVIDCDSGSIENNANSILVLPEREERWLIEALNQCMIPQATLGSLTARKSKDNDNSNSSAAKSHTVDEEIQLLIFDVLLHLLRYLPDCLFYLNSTCPLFNRPLFLSDYTIPEYHQTLVMLTATNAFHELTESFHTPSVAYFYTCVDRLAEEEMQILLAAEQQQQQQQAGAAAAAASANTDASTPDNHSNSHMSSELSPLQWLKKSSSGRDDHPLLHNNNNNKSSYALSSHGHATPSSFRNFTSTNQHKSLQRQASVKSIIYDKIIHSTPLGGGGNNTNAAFGMGISTPPSTSTAVAAGTPGAGQQGSLAKVMHSRPGGIIRRFSSAKLSIEAMEAASAGTMIGSSPSSILLANQSHSMKMKSTSSNTTHANSNNNNYNNHNKQTSLPLARTFSMADVHPHGSMDTPLGVGIAADEQSSAHIAAGYSSSIAAIEMIYAYFPHWVIDEYLALPTTGNNNNEPHSKEGKGQHYAVMSIADLVDFRIQYFNQFEEEEKNTNKYELTLPVKVHSKEEEESIIVPSTTSKLSPRINETDGSAMNGDGNSSFLPWVQFHKEGIEKREIHSVTWTAKELAARIPEANLEDIQDFMEELVDPWSSSPGKPSMKGNNNNVPVTRRNSVVNGLNQRNSRMKGSSGSSNLHHHHSGQHKQELVRKKIASGVPNVTLDVHLMEFLQKAVTAEDMDTDYLTRQLPKCMEELGKLDNRKGLINILKHAKKEQGGGMGGGGMGGSGSGKRRGGVEGGAGGGAGGGIYLLHDGAFEAFSLLFNSMLSICADQRDYLNAYGLLEVGGHYFRKLPDDVIQNMLMLGYTNLEEDIIEFLNEKTFQHPIFQNPYLWLALLKDRLATLMAALAHANKANNTSATNSIAIGDLSSSAIMAVKQRRNTTTVQGGEIGHSHSKPTFPMIFTETKSLLYNMNSISVNSARAIAFIQSIASEYRLSVDEYYQIHRFLTQLWEQSTGGGNNGGGGGGAGTTTAASIASSMMSAAASGGMQDDLQQGRSSHGGGSGGIGGFGGSGLYSMKYAESSESIILTNNNNNNSSNGSSYYPNQLPPYRTKSKEGMMMTAVGGGGSAHQSGMMMRDRKSSFAEVMNKQGHRKISRTLSSASKHDVNITSAQQMLVERERERANSQTRDLPLPMDGHSSGGSNSQSNSMNYQFMNNHSSHSVHNNYDTHSNKQANNAVAVVKHVRSLTEPAMKEDTAAAAGATDETADDLLLSVRIDSGSSMDLEEDNHHDDDKQHHHRRDFLLARSSSSGIMEVTPARAAARNILLSESHDDHDDPDRGRHHLHHSHSHGHQAATAAAAHSVPHHAAAAAVAHRNRRSTIADISSSGRPPVTPAAGSGKGSLNNIIIPSPTPSIRSNSYHSNSHHSSHDSPYTTNKPGGSGNNQQHSPEGNHGHNSSAGHNSNGKPLLSSFKFIEIKGLDATKVQKFVTISNWLITGNEDGQIQIADLYTCQVLSGGSSGSGSITGVGSSASSGSSSSHAGGGRYYYKHSGASSREDYYRGITAMATVPAACMMNNNNQEYIIFTGCSQGIVKVWTLPHISQQQGNGSQQQQPATAKNSTKHTNSINNGKNTPPTPPSPSIWRRGSTSSVNTTLAALQPLGYTSNRFMISSGVAGSRSSKTVNQPQQEQNYAKTLRLKPPILLHKGHLGEVTCFASELYGTNTVAPIAAHPHHTGHPSSPRNSAPPVMMIAAPSSSSSMGWIMASGDIYGEVMVTRSVGDSSRDLLSKKVRTTVAAATAAAAQAASSSSFSATSSSSSNASKTAKATLAQAKSMADPITCLAFVSTGSSGSSGSMPSSSATAANAASSSANNTTTNSNLNAGLVAEAVKQATLRSAIIPIHTATASATSNNAAMVNNHWEPYLLALGTRRGTVAVLDYHLGQVIFQVENAHSQQVSKLLSLKPYEFLSCGYDRMIKLWDIRTMKNPASNAAAAAAAAAGPSTTLATVSHNSHAATASLPQMIKTYDERSLGGNLHQRCAATPITEVAVGGWDSSLIISAAADGSIRLWDLRYDFHQPCCAIIHGHQGHRISTILWQGQDEFYTAAYDGCISSWDSIHGRSTSSISIFGQQPGRGSHAEEKSSTTRRSSSFDSQQQQDQHPAEEEEEMVDEGILAMSMTDFYHRLPSSLTMDHHSHPNHPSGSSNSNAGGGGGCLLLHRTCFVSNSWHGNLKIIAHDHFIQTEQR